MRDLFYHQNSSLSTIFFTFFDIFCFALKCIVIPGAVNKHWRSAGPPEFDFNESLNFIEEGMLDSFDIINLVTALDSEFSISIDGMDVLPDNFSSVERIEALLKKNGVEV